MSPPVTRKMSSGVIALKAGQMQRPESQEALATELATAMFTQRKCMGDHTVLASCAAQAGLGPEADVADVLGDPSRFRDEVPMPCVLQSSGNRHFWHTGRVSAVTLVLVPRPSR